MEKQAKKTFAMPFVILASLVTPSLVVTLYIRPTAGYDALIISGWFALVKLILAATLALATLCGLIYLVRAEGKSGRAIVIIILAALWSGFWLSIR